MNDPKWTGLGVWVPDCGRLPRGYGIAWIDPMNARAFTLPVPLNILVGLLRRLYLWLQDPFGQSDRIAQAFRAGYRAGRDEEVQQQRHDEEQVIQTVLRRSWERRNGSSLN